MHATNKLNRRRMSKADKDDAKNELAKEIREEEEQRYSILSVETPPSAIKNPNGMVYTVMRTYSSGGY